MKKRRRRRGFTLIEILVVVAIISILAAASLSVAHLAKLKSMYAKGSLDQRTLQAALELYYEDHNDWPPAGGKLYADTSPTGGWTTLAGYIQPYLPTTAFPGFETISPCTGCINQGFSYSKGMPGDPVGIKTWDSLTGLFVGCIYVYKGYYADFVLPQQSYLTLADGGIDPDGMELMDGDYIIYRDLAHCPG